jgi:anti-sigma factor RsiW
MNCKDIGEFLIDVAAGEEPSAAVKQHLFACPACSERLESVRRTMSLMDEWKAPEPSQYFNSRLQARLRDEAANQSFGWLSWLRKPVLAASMAGLMIVGVLTLRQTSNDLKQSRVVVVQAEPGTAVGDLLVLDRDQELFANFDLLDEFTDQELPNQFVDP